MEAHITLTSEVRITRLESRVDSLERTAERNRKILEGETGMNGLNGTTQTILAQVKAAEIASERRFVSLKTRIDDIDLDEAKKRWHVWQLLVGIGLASVAQVITFLLFYWATQH